MTRPLSKAISDLVKRKIASDAPTFLIGVWQAAEATDANLSQVKSGGQTLRYVPKAASATGLVLGSKVLMVKAPGVPLIILCEIVGNITLVA